MECMPDVLHFTFLGEGQNGAVLLLKGDGDKTQVVKITYWPKFENEASIAQKLDVLRPVTQAFITTFGFQVRRGLPNGWKGLLPSKDNAFNALDWDEYDRAPAIVLIFMEHANHRIAFPNASASTGSVYWHHLNFQEAKQVLFILLHGLMVARKELGFSHNDIHDGQVMLLPILHKKRVLLGTRHHIDHCRFMPKFIDFGASTLDNAGDSSLDVWQLKNLFGELFNMNTELYETEEFQLAEASDCRDYQVIARILDLPFFSEFQSKNKRTKASVLCIGCMSSATHLIDDTNYHVCGNPCAHKLYH
jgi:hypothetical protein